MKELKNKPVRRFDVVIVGGGVGGMTTAVYAKRRGKSVAILEKFALGGTLLSLGKIENFPSQPQIDGVDLAKLFSEQVKTQQIEVVRDEVMSSALGGKEKHLVGKKAEYVCQSVVIATGLTYRTLGIGEEKYIGRGVSYCATCDANFFRGQEVCIAGKNGSALHSAMKLAEVCSCVNIFDEGDLSAFEKSNSNKKIKVFSSAKVLAVGGEKQVEFVEVSVCGRVEKFQTKALFVDVGRFADLSAFSGIEKDEKGFVLTDERMKTSLDGVFAVGDVRAKNLRQIVTACSDGAIAGVEC